MSQNNCVKKEGLDPVLFDSRVRSRPDMNCNKDIMAGDEEITHDDMWDDTLLIQQYDEAMGKARQQLASKLHSASSVSDSDGSLSIRTEAVNGKFPSKPYHSSSLKKKKKKKSRKKNEWQTGDPCRAHFSGDGDIYEATIISLNNAVGTCTVRYMGFNNCEEVALSSLLKSRGEAARKKQLSDAYIQVGHSSQTDEVTEDSGAAESDTAAEEQERGKRLHNKKGFNMMSPNSHCYGSIHSPVNSIPPLPHLPPPPALGLVDSRDSVSSEALHTMLMSWYMTGYHTGYYQGLTHGRSSVRPKQQNSSDDKQGHRFK